MNNNTYDTWSTHKAQHQLSVSGLEQVASVRFASLFLLIMLPHFSYGCYISNITISSLLLFLLSQAAAFERFLVGDRRPSAPSPAVVLPRGARPVRHTLVTFWDCEAAAARQTKKGSSPQNLRNQPPESQKPAPRISETSPQKPRKHFTHQFSTRAPPLWKNGKPKNFMTRESLPRKFLLHGPRVAYSTCRGDLLCWLRLGWLDHIYYKCTCT